MAQHPLPRSFRLVCPPEDMPSVEALLRAEGYAFAPEPFCGFCRRLLAEPAPLGASLAARFGYVYIQDRSSMLPPLALNPAPGETVLDMCASPGSKTGMLGQLVGGSGFVLGNEPSRKRLATLRHNMQLLNLMQCGTMSHPGEQLPLPTAGEGWPGFARILLDPPCSGWGTAEKNPQVLRLWQGDRLDPLIHLQRRLLAEAARLLRPGGCVAYSTCTTNAAENEEQLRYACDELGLVFAPLQPPPGFSPDAPTLAEFAGCWRIGGGEDGQGFFVALLQKPADGDGNAKARAVAHEGEGKPPARAAEAPGAFFASPRHRDSRFVGERRRHKTVVRRDQDEFLRLLDAKDIDGPGVDCSLLPPGELALFGTTVRFLPSAAAVLPGRGLGTGLHWKGFALGSVGKTGAVRVSPHARLLMPSAEAARARGLLVLDVDECAPLYDLISGRGLALGDAAKGTEAGLYFRGLPLCRLAVKGKRAVLFPGW